MLEKENAAQAESTGRPATFGEKAVGLSFNPGGSDDVNKIKKSFADIIDVLDKLRSRDPLNKEVNRMLSVAITESQSAQMWAVKAVTWQH